MAEKTGQSGRTIQDGEIDLIIISTIQNGIEYGHFFYSNTDDQTSS